MRFVALKRRRHTAVHDADRRYAQTETTLPESRFCAACACTVPSLFGLGEMRCLTARGALSILPYHSSQEELS